MTLRLHIDATWDAADFATFFRSLDDLYNVTCEVLEREFYPEFGRPYAFDRRRALKGTRFRLEVKAISFSSPGFTDLVGLAAAMREIREFLQFVISFVSSRADRELDREKERIEVARLKVELLEKLAELEREYGVRMPLSAERHLGIKSAEMPDIDPLLNAVLDGRLTAVSKLEEEE